MSDDKALFRIKQQRAELLKRYYFFGILALHLKLKVEPAVGTMGTDGQLLAYNPDFVNGLSNEHLKSAVAHEVLHPALAHIWRRGKYESDRWNRAADHAVNLILKQQGFAIPDAWHCDERFRGMSAEKIYTLLTDEDKNGEQFDYHGKWGEGDDGDKKAGSRASENGEIWKDRVGKAAAAARMFGNLPGGLQELVDDVLSPKLDWKIILRNMLTNLALNDYRLMPPNKKHLWRGIYLPSITGNRIEIAAGLDTSGSVTLKQDQEFIAEIKGITRQFSDYMIHLYFCDAEIHDKMILTPYTPWPEKFPKRGGGTSFRPVFEDIARNNLQVSAIVYLTDGEGMYPDHMPHIPTIWVLNSNYKVPWGESIYIYPKVG